MGELWGVLAAVVAVVTASIAIFFRVKGQDKTPAGPMENTAASAAGEAITQTLKDDIDRINEAGRDNTPADSLADLGNTRKRRTE